MYGSNRNQFITALYETKCDEKSDECVKNLHILKKLLFITTLIKIRKKQYFD